MNNENISDVEHLRSLQILDELARNDTVTQRELSSRLGIALGLVNSYIKNLVSKGFITVKAIPPKRYAYYLTPKGFSEKTRLTYHLLQDYTRIYREARSSLKKLFQELQAAGVRRIVFAGADEVAEIAYISLQETRMELVDVVDDDSAGRNFFGKQVQPLDAVRGMEYEVILISSYMKRDQIIRKLTEAGIKREVIRMSLS